MTVYVCSTLSTGMTYALWRKAEGGAASVIEKQVIIRGGANVAHRKTLVTPRGVVTPVKDEDYAILKDNELFKRHLANGFISIADVEKHPEVMVAAEMQQRDDSSPRTPEDYDEEKAAIEDALPVKRGEEANEESGFFKQGDEKEINMGAVPYFTFDVTAFRTAYPAFANTPPTDATLQMYWDQAGSFIANDNYGWMRDLNRALALNLMTAHLAALSALIAAGQTPVIVTGAGIDKVNVTLEPPPTLNQWKWWLSTTPYGAEMLALLAGFAAGGWGVGGSPTRAAFHA